jgi:hypothetical protein
MKYVPAGTSLNVILAKTLPPDASRELMNSELGLLVLVLARIEVGIPYHQAEINPRDFTVELV